MQHESSKEPKLNRNFPRLRISNNKSRISVVICSPGLNSQIHFLRRIFLSPSDRIYNQADIFKGQRDQIEMRLLVRYVV